MRRALATLSLVASAASVAGCAGLAQGGWTTLLDGSDPSSMQNWTRLGDANWRAADGVIVADKGSVNSYLVSKGTYKDFQVRAEFYAEGGTNSGVLIRCDSATKVGADTCYEVDIRDTAPAPAYGTGAIVGVVNVSPVPLAGGHWNTYVITALGSRLMIELNGVRI